MHLHCRCIAGALQVHCRCIAGAVQVHCRSLQELIEASINSLARHLGMNSLFNLVPINSENMGM